MANKRPWYHVVRLVFTAPPTVSLREARTWLGSVAFPGLVRGTILVSPDPDVQNGYELLFTATRELDASRVREAVEFDAQLRAGLKVAIVHCDAAPGDPADLL